MICCGLPHSAPGYFDALLRRPGEPASALSTFWLNHVLDERAGRTSTSPTTRRSFIAHRSRHRFPRAGP